MIRTGLLLFGLIFIAPAARADAVLVPLTGKTAAEYGYTVRMVEVGKKKLVFLELTPAAAKAFGHGEVTLTKDGQTVVEATLAITKDGKGNGTLKLTIDPAAIDGGELTIWSAPIDGAPLVANFGGFRVSVADLLRWKEEDGTDLLLRTMEGYRKTFPEAQGLGEMNGFTIGPDKDGKSYTLSHLDGVAKRLGVKTRAECMALLTYLKDPDDKLRYVAAFAIESAVKAYPGGMSTSDIKDVGSEGHRTTVAKFVAGIERLPK